MKIPNKLKIGTAIHFLALLPISAFAAEDITTPFLGNNLTEAGSGAVGTSYLVELFTGLAIVVAAILVLGWIFKRLVVNPNHAAGTMRVLSGIAVGQRERLVLVQVGEQQMLIGVAPGSVNAIHLFDEPLIDASLNDNLNKKDESLILKMLKRKGIGSLKADAS